MMNNKIYMEGLVKLQEAFIKEPEFYKAGIYIRLSESDEGKTNQEDSESIVNQRNILVKYASEKGFVLRNEYVDDGFSGTNFNRPGFKKMINDIKNKVINLVIVKDLSRLGRDHIMTGYYLERFFPENNIRFISLQEGYDNFLNQASNDSSSFILACNDYYSKQNSVKIRNVLSNKRKNGQFVGSTPSYGYLRDPKNKGHLIKDEKYAPVVKKIFEMAFSGVGISEIATFLNINNIRTPSSLKRKPSNIKSGYNEIWTVSSVRKILKNRMYVGDMVQGTQTKISYKSPNKKMVPENCWDIVLNTHEPIIDRNTFSAVQNNIRILNNTIRINRKKRLFENLLYCRECGNMLTVSYRKNHNYWTVNCNKYSRDPKRRLCEPHFIPYDKLENELLKIIKNTYKKYIDFIGLSDFVIKLSKTRTEDGKMNNKIVQLKNQEKNIIHKLDVLYEDKFNKIISEEMYQRLAKQTEETLNKVRKEILLLVSNETNHEKSTKIFAENKNIFNSLINIENPQRDLIKAFVNRIIIDKNRNIEIFYKFSNIK